MQLVVGVAFNRADIAAGYPLASRELVRESRQFDAREFRILAAQQVIDMFLDEESQNLAMLSDFIGKPISLQVESAYNQEQFDIVLM